MRHFPAVRFLAAKASGPFSEYVAKLINYSQSIKRTYCQTQINVTWCNIIAGRPSGTTVGLLWGGGGGAVPCRKLTMTLIICLVKYLEELVLHSE